jgi:hypothetical protein
MATATTKAKTKSTDKSAVDHLQEALSSLDQARTAASGELRDQIDEATDRVREAVDDLRGRAGDELREIEDSLDRASDHLIVELGLRGVRAQRSTEALTKLSAEIRKRKAELTASAAAK